MERGTTVSANVGALDVLSGSFSTQSKAVRWTDIDDSDPAFNPVG
jgi:hypothetical protein